MSARNKYTQCAHCNGATCFPSTGINDPLPPIEDAPQTCPMRQYEEVIRDSAGHYHKANIREFAYQASIQEARCYESDEHGLRTRVPRIEETIQFAEKCQYTSLGLAFCMELQAEARLISKIFKDRGFDVASVCCKVGRTPKESIGIEGENKINGADAMEPMCNPIVQAKILNHQEVDLVVLLGLCVGHDTLFFKYCELPCTVLAVKDRVLAHNPLGAVYPSDNPYYRHLHRTVERPEPEGGWKKIDIMKEDDEDSL